ncbi:MAG: flagellar filament capping protein FliD [Verrucomicrobiae bacterium]
MAGIQLSGLSSGLDWKSLVDQLISVSSTPKTTMAKEQATNSTRSSALTNVKNLLTAFQSTLTSDFTEASFQQRLAASTTTSGAWKASSASGGTIGNFAFNVTTLATAAKRAGASDVTGGLNATSDVSGLLISAMRTSQTVTAGEFTINGSRIAVATTDTLQDVFSRISTATGGTVTAAYDPVSDGVTLTGASLSLGSSADTSNFLSALKLFQNGTGTVSSSGTLGASKLTVPLVNSGLKSAITAVDGSGNGKFTINGAEIAYNVNTDSLQAVMTRINGSAAGVTASYDSASDRFTLTNKTTGNVSMFAEETGAGFLAATGMIGAGSSFQSGVNAEFSVNGGGSITSLSNTLDESITGITGLSVTADSTGTQTIGVSSDIQSARTKLDTLISKYNAVQTAIEGYTKVTVNGTKVTSGPLSGNSDVESISSKLRSIIFAAGSGQTGEVQRLSDLGIDFSSTESSLAVRDSATLTSMLTSYGEDVGSFFSDSTSGLVKRLGDFLKTQVADTGSLTIQTTNITKQNADLDKQMAALDLQLASERSLLESSFIAMETASSAFQTQAAQLTAAFG